MLLKYQTISQQYYLESHHSFCNKTIKYIANKRTVFQYFIWKTAKTNVCLIHGTNSIFYCYYAMLCKLLWTVKWRKKIRILCCRGIHLYLFDTHKFICLTLKSIFFLSGRKNSWIQWFINSTESIGFRFTQKILIFHRIIFFMPTKPKKNSWYKR